MLHYKPSACRKVLIEPQAPGGHRPPALGRLFVDKLKAKEFLDFLRSVTYMQIANVACDGNLMPPQGVASSLLTLPALPVLLPADTLFS